MVSLVIIVAGYLVGTFGVAYGIIGLNDERYSCKFDIKAFFKDYKIKPPVNILIESLLTLVATTIFHVWYLSFS